MKNVLAQTYRVIAKKCNKCISLKQDRLMLAFFLFLTAFFFLNTFFICTISSEIFCMHR